MGKNSAGVNYWRTCVIVISICYSCSGCIATQTLNRKIKDTPHTIAGLIRYDYGVYKGIIAVKNTDMYAYYVANPIFLGGNRNIIVLAPVEQYNNNTAILLSHVTQDTEDYLTKHGLPADLFSTADWRTGIPAIAYAGSVESDVLSLRGFDGSGLYKIKKVEPGTPNVIGIILDKNDRAIQLRIGRRRVDKKGGSDWNWSSPYLVNDAITRATLWQRTWPLGYVVTVPFDIVTFPIQILLALIASRGLI